MQKNPQQNLESFIHQIYPNAEDVVKFPGGASSSTYKLNLKGQMYVLKFNIDELIYSYIDSLVKQVGILTPKVFHTGSYKGLTYVLMEYIQGDILNKNIQENTFVKLANMLKQIHTIQGSGFGKLQKEEKEGCYDTFREFILNQFLRSITFKKENLDYHLEKVEEYYKLTPETVFCHMDLSTSNIVQNKSNLYLIDYGNQAGFNYNLFDVTKSIVNDSRFENVLFKYKDAYGFDLDIMESLVYIVGLRKIASWKRRGKEERIGNLLALFKDLEIE